MANKTPQQEQLLLAMEREYRVLLPRKLSQLEERHQREREEARSKFYGQLEEAVRLEIPIQWVKTAMGTKDYLTIRKLYERFGYTGKRVD